ncbi:MAG: HD domain-containing protein [Methylococcales bacterium]|nr:HD domain-containing protein [Methylococcales bacterium]
MITDLLDLTEANILLISTEHSDNIVHLLKANDYHKVHCANNIQQAISLYEANLPDLIIFSPCSKLAFTELTTQLETEHPLPPIFLINDTKNHIPSVDTAIKDFINTPIDENEFLYRVHHLLTTQLSSQELHNYNQTILNAVEKRTEELRESQIEIIECLGYAAEFRDTETGMHTIRVGLYSQRLAQAMGMNDKEAESLLYAAPMHDVGKIGIPDNILLKPGRLDGKEWEVMKQHTTIGQRILTRSKNKLLQQAGVIALSHHEKWNGSGYPNSLKGTDIPIDGRLVALADVFDALTMERPYKKAWTISSAVDLINSESSKHFDPSLVKLFNDTLPEIITIKKEYTDDKSNTLLTDYIAPP